MFLRFRYRLGFETLCAEVTDSLAWRRFCRIGITDAVPHPTTLMKITTRCGEQAVDQLNEALLRKADAAHVVKLDRVRADTTVVPANVSYPTDSGLLSKGVAKLTKTVRAIQALGLARRTRFRNRTRSVRRRAHQVAAWLRRRSGDAKDEVLGAHRRAGPDRRRRRQRRPFRGHKCPASAACGRAIRPRAGPPLWWPSSSAPSGRWSRSWSRPAPASPARSPTAADRVVSLHDTDARPIRKGRLGRPVEFGYKAQVTDNAHGIVLDHVVELGNPPDAPMLAPAIARVTKLFGQVPKAVTADRGYGEATVETELESMGVKHVAIPRRGRPGPQRQQIEFSPPLPQARQVAHRFRRSDRAPEALLGMGPHHARRHRRCAHLVRMGCARTQRHQDRRSHRRTRNKERFNANQPAHSHRTTDAAIHHHRRTVPPDTVPASPVTPPVRKRPENGGENDRRGRDRASRGHSRCRSCRERSVPTPGFSGRSS